eukprot:2904743-Pyramimonas_sp.AAC.2
MPVGGVMYEAPLIPVDDSRFGRRFQGLHEIPEGALAPVDVRRLGCRRGALAPDDRRFGSVRCVARAGFLALLEGFGQAKLVSFVVLVRILDSRFDLVYSLTVSFFSVVLQ